MALSALRMLILALVVLLLTAAIPLEASPLSSDKTQQSSSRDLSDDERAAADVDPREALVAEYFRQPDNEKAEELAEKIEEMSSGDWRGVARLIRQTKLWSKLEGVDGGGILTLPSYEGHKGRRASCRVPVDYDPTKSYPAIICFASTAELPQRALAVVASHFGPSADSAVVMIIDANHPEFHFDGPIECSYLKDHLVLLRRLLHVDVDRTFAFGIGKSGDAAWQAALSYPDVFAGLVVVDGFPHVPYAQQVLPFMLANMSQVPVLASWKETDLKPESRAVFPSDRSRLVDLHLRLAHQIASERGWPWVFRVSSEAEPRRSPFRQQTVDAFLKRTRPAAGHPVEQWLRVPGQGDRGWLRAVEIKEPIWEPDQLSILPAPTIDADSYITSVVQEKMAYLSGSISGNTIIVNTRSCEQVEILLCEGVLDFAKPITIVCNGQQRRSKVYSPSIRAMLEAARQDRDYERLVLGRVLLSIRRDMKD